MTRADNIRAALAVVLAEAERGRKLVATADIEARMTGRMRILFGNQLTALLNRIRPAFAASEPRRMAQGDSSGGTNPYWDDIAAATYEIWRRAVESFVQEAMGIGGNAIMAELGISGVFDLANPRAVAYLEQAPPLAVERILATTGERVRPILTQAANEGWGYGQTAARLRELWQGFAAPAAQAHIRDRAELIAVTEVGQAYEEGQKVVIAGMQERGMAMEKAWLAVDDDHLEYPMCGDNEAQGWIPVEDAFQSGHDSPLAHPACRCSCLYRRVGAITE